MPINIFSPNTKILSSLVNGNFSGLSDGSLDQVANNLATTRKAAFSSFVISGGTIATSANLSTTIAAMTAIINGKYVSIGSTVITVAASKDTYIYIKDDGTVVTSNSVTNNTASPAATTNSDGTNALLLAIVVSSGTAITGVNQGSPAATVPTVSSINLAVCDSLGNLIYPVASTPGLIGYRQITSQFNAASTSDQDLTGLSLPVIVPAGRRVRVTFFGPQVLSSVDSCRIDIGIQEDGTDIQRTYTRVWTGGNGGNGGMLVAAIKSPTTGAHTYKVRLATGLGSGLGSVFASSASPSYISVELV